VEPSLGGRAVSPNEELAVARAERYLCQVRLRQAASERDNLRTDLAEARAELEYWRTLAEYRERRLIERQAGTDAKIEPIRAKLRRGG